MEDGEWEQHSERMKGNRQIDREMEKGKRGKEGPNRNERTG